MMKKIIVLIASTLSIAVHAHIVVTPPIVESGTYEKLTFHVTHGCGKSPTRELIIFIPESLQGARPMPKPGWEIDIESQELSRPYESHGRMIQRDVRKITWKGGNLPNDYWDEFSIRVRVAGNESQLPIVVHQICQEGRWEWSQLSASGEKLKSPAPIIEIKKSKSHQHH